MEKLKFKELPKIGQPLDGGTFAGLTTRKDGQHAAVVLLPFTPQYINWASANEWAKKGGGELPTRPVAALLFANVKDKLELAWHWTADEEGASFAWICYFDDGDQSSYHKSNEGSAVAVRLIPLAD